MKDIERFILKKMKAVDAFHWELLDDSGMIVIKKIVEDEDQGPTKEWGPFGWYCHPTTLHIDKARMGKTVHLLSTVPF